MKKLCKLINLSTPIMLISLSFISCYVSNVRNSSYIESKQCNFSDYPTSYKSEIFSNCNSRPSPDNYPDYYYSFYGFNSLQYAPEKSPKIEYSTFFYNESIVSSWFTFDIVNPSMFEFKTMDEWVYYGNLLNDGLVRNLSFNVNAKIFIDDYPSISDYENLSLPLDTPPSCTSPIYYQNINIWNNFSTGHSGGNDRWLYTTPGFTLYIKVNDVLMDKFNFGDYLQVMYDTKTNSIKTRININAAIPSMEPKIEIGVSSMVDHHFEIECSDYMIEDLVKPDGRYPKGFNWKDLDEMYHDHTYYFVNMRQKTVTTAVENYPFLIIKSSND